MKELLPYDPHYSTEYVPSTRWHFLPHFLHNITRYNHYHRSEINKNKFSYWFWTVLSILHIVAIFMALSLFVLFLFGWQYPDLILTWMDNANLTEFIDKEATGLLVLSRAGTKLSYQRQFLR